MRLVEKINELQTELKSFQDKLIGFVPTMGYLHEGHLSLVRKAKEECDVVVMSIFVNPLQFGPQEDFSSYPRDLERDQEKALQAGVDFLFYPSIKEMYNEDSYVTVRVARLADVLCGEHRAGHFDGVATVVTKLFHIAQPNRAYFGQKDAQQVAIITQMVDDLSFPITIVPCETIREKDGLALSSRNVYLSPAERKQAVILYKALAEAKQGLKKKRWQTVKELNAYIRDRIATEPLAEIQYIETLTYPNLKVPTSLYNKQIIAAVAVYFGSTRLIDNFLFTTKG